MNTSEDCQEVADGQRERELTEAQRRLAEENVRLAYDVVYRYKVRNLAVRVAVDKLGDERAVSEALYGLVKAARGYIPSRGFKFSTYAFPVIVREVVSAGRSCGRLTERWLNGKPERAPLLSQFGPVGLDGDEQEFVPDGRGDDRPYGEDEVEVLRAAIDRIPEVERVILVRRFFNRETLVEIGAALGVSREAIRQTQQKALARLRQMMVEDEP